jgi:hypothetical protein
VVGDPDDERRGVVADRIVGLGEPLERPPPVDLASAAVEERRVQAPAGGHCGPHAECALEAAREPRKPLLRRAVERDEVELARILRREPVRRRPGKVAGPYLLDLDPVVPPQVDAPAEDDRDRNEADRHEGGPPDGDQG